jgi:hypothetical protein
MNNENGQCLFKNTLFLRNFKTKFLDLKTTIKNMETLFYDSYFVELFPEYFVKINRVVIIYNSFNWVFANNDCLNFRKKKVIVSEIKKC